MIPIPIVPPVVVLNNDTFVALLTTSNVLALIVPVPVIFAAHVPTPIFIVPVRDTLFAILIVPVVEVASAQVVHDEHVVPVFDQPLDEV